MSQRIFIVTGAKGGVGTTTLAAKLVQRFPAPADRMIVDADLSGKRSLAILYDLSDDLDLSRVIGSATVVQAPGGPLVMELARTYEDGLVQTSGSTTRALAALGEHALIVVDAPQPFASAVRPFLMRAAKILVVSESTMLGVSSALAGLTPLHRLGIAASRIALVQSDVRGKTDVPRSDVERMLGVPVSAEMPNASDRRYEGRFDGLLTLLAASTPHVGATAVEKPVFDRRYDAGEAMR